MFCNRNAYFVLMMELQSNVFIFFFESKPLYVLINFQIINIIYLV